MKITAVFIALTVSAACFADCWSGSKTLFTLSGTVAQDFATLPAVKDDYRGYDRLDQPLWGIGWEVVLKRIGLGGTYMVSFSHDDQDRDLLNWYCQGFFISYHFLGGGAFLDPFIQAGAGCAGRARLKRSRDDDDEVHVTGSDVSLTLFPYLSAGVALDLDGFTFGGKLNYVPFQSEVPVTDILPQPVGSFQVQLFVGVTFGR
jgi:hypothetical protein